MRKEVIILSSCLVVFFSCQKQSDGISPENMAVESGSATSSNSVSDNNGNTYKTVKIGNKIWMAENLRTTKFRNGDAIPNVTDRNTWANSTNPSWCYYNNNSAYNSIYGKLYNFAAANDPRGLAPAGWHIPSSAEWMELFTAVGGFDYAGGPLKATGTRYWLSPNLGATNSFKFSALPGGYRTGPYGDFSQLGADCWFMYIDNGSVGHWNLRYDLVKISTRMQFGYWNYLTESSGVSIRCVKD